MVGKVNRSHICISPIRYKTEGGVLTLKKCLKQITVWLRHFFWVCVVVAHMLLSGIVYLHRSIYEYQVSAGQYINRYLFTNVSLPGQRAEVELQVSLQVFRGRFVSMQVRSWVLKITWWQTQVEKYFTYTVILICVCIMRRQAALQRFWVGLLEKVWGELQALWRWVWLPPLHFCAAVPPTL